MLGSYLLSSVEEHSITKGTIPTAAYCLYSPSADTDFHDFNHCMSLSDESLIRGTVDPISYQEPVRLNSIYSFFTAL